MVKVRFRMCMSVQVMVRVKLDERMRVSYIAVVIIRVKV